MNAPTYLNKAGVADVLGVGRPVVTRYHLPEPDAHIQGANGKLDPVWLPETIEAWNKQRNPNRRKTSQA
ncbi:XRE family transcriptional regulator [Rothia terrae]|uniref:XRE family transcriptional regulator n=1 Tax=Rothia terrae TaxID=396015 RepID=UPI003815A20D